MKLLYTCPMLLFFVGVHTLRDNCTCLAIHTTALRFVSSVALGLRHSN